MSELLKLIEERKRGYKEEFQELVNSTSANSIEINTISNWLDSKDHKLVAAATSFIDELGSKKPELCLTFTDKLLELLKSKKNRLVWGSLTALESYAELITDILFQNLDQIISASEKSSVVAKDHAVQIYQKLAKVDDYYDSAIELMLEQVRICADNQLGQYAERTLDVIRPERKNELIEALRLRIAGLENHHHVRRVESAIQKARKIN